MKSSDLFNPRNLKERGPGFVTLYAESEPRQSIGRAGDPLPAAWFGVRIFATFRRPGVARALAQWIAPSMEDQAAGALVLCRSAEYSEQRIEADIYGEHAGTVLSAVMRLQPLAVRCDTVSV